MIFTRDYTRIAAFDAIARYREKVDELLEMAREIKWSNVNQPRPWTQRRINELRQSITMFIGWLRLYGKKAPAVSSKIERVLLEGQKIFADMPWREGEPGKWYKWSETLDDKVNEFLQKMEAIK
jgi:hypothetical protein